MVTTREYDIQKIEQDIKRGYISRKKGYALIDKMHKQTKDHDLEDRRKKLIEDQKKYDRKYRVLRQDPEKMTKDQLQNAIKYFNANPHEF